MRGKAGTKWLPGRRDQSGACRAARLVWMVSLCAGWFAAWGWAPEAQAAQVSVTVQPARLIVQGADSGSLPVVQQGKDSYVSVYALQQMLRRYGIASSWRNRQFRVDGLPVLDGAAETFVNDRKLPSGLTFSLGGRTYVDASAIAAVTGGLSLPASSQPPALGGRSAAGKQAASGIPFAAQFGLAGGKPGNIRAMNVNGQAYLDALTLAQAFWTSGIDAHLSNGTLLVDALPMVQQVSVSARSVSVRTSAISYEGHWYLPAPVLRTLGVDISVQSQRHMVMVQAKLSSNGGSVSGRAVNGDGSPLSGGQLAVMDAFGTLVCWPIQPDGSFKGQLDTAAGTIVGIEAPSGAWTGEAIPVARGRTGVEVKAEDHMTRMHGHLVFSGKPFPVSEISVRDLITHVHYYAAVDAQGNFTLTIPQGAYEAFAVLSGQSPAYVLQPFVAGSGGVVDVNLRPLPQHGQLISARARIQAADGKVTALDLLSVDAIFEHVYDGVAQDVQVKANQPVDVNLYSSPATYATHFVSEGFSTQEARNIAAQSVAVSEGPTSISVSIAALGSVDGLNILAHELTHSLMDYRTTGLPTWASEGFAWHEGVKGELDGSPSLLLAQGIQWYEWADVVYHAEHGDLLPLDTSDTIDADYNVEAQDYFAVENDLLETGGVAKFLSFASRVTNGADAAFQGVYGKPFSQFAQQVKEELVQLSKNSDDGFILSFKALPDCPGSAYIITPQGTAWSVSGLRPGQVYQLVCHNDGTVLASAGLTVSRTNGLEPAVRGDWFFGVQTTGEFSRQEFDVANVYGTPFDVGILLYDKSGQLAHTYPALALPAGLQLTGIAPYHDTHGQTMP